jgi:hypothetical protein
MLAGKTIRRVRFLSLAELAREGWGAHEWVLALELDDGTLLYAARDEEGNGPGALFGKDKEGQFRVGQEPVTTRPNTRPKRM